MPRRVAVLLVLTIGLGSARLLACELACADGRAHAQAASCHDESSGTTVATPQTAHCIAEEPGVRTAVKPGITSFVERLALAHAPVRLLPHAPVESGTSGDIGAPPERLHRPPAVLRI